MSETQNTQVVKDAYAAFQRGDIATILNAVADDVEWQGVIGTEAVGDFFKQVADSTEFTAFEPKEFVAQGDQVVAIGTYAARMKPSGHPYSSGWVMVFTVRDGKITRFREYTDSAQLVRAYSGVAARV
jgi:ketosteroid isomerase-like protein